MGWLVALKEKNQLKDLSLDGRTILKLIFFLNMTGSVKLHSIALV